MADRVEVEAAAALEPGSSGELLAASPGGSAEEAEVVAAAEVAPEGAVAAVAGTDNHRAGAAAQEAVRNPVEHRINLRYCRKRRRAKKTPLGASCEPKPKTRRMANRAAIRNLTESSPRTTVR